jgi:hypothetical protein
LRGLLPRLAPEVDGLLVAKWHQVRSSCWRRVASETARLIPSASVRLPIDSTRSSSRSPAIALTPAYVSRTSGWPRSVREGTQAGRDSGEVVRCFVDDVETGALDRARERSVRRRGQRRWVHVDRIEPTGDTGVRSAFGRRVADRARGGRRCRTRGGRHPLRDRRGPVGVGTGLRSFVSDGSVLRRRKVFGSVSLPTSSHAPVPAAHFAAVARVLAFVYRLRGTRPRASRR